ncbi:MAG: ATP synthase F1 subunit delta [Ignavibacteriales bacterium]|nr:ATP synthase F1 subunit delta [Ignavibacteriales bacterium]
MSAYRVARRYAEAALELAEEQKQGERVADDLEVVWKAIRESREFLALLKSPVISKEKKRAVLSAVFKSRISALSFDFLNMIVEKGREDVLGDIIGEYFKLRDDRLGIVTLEVRAATELSKSQQQSIVKRFEEITQKKVRVAFSIDAQLKGGFVARVGDTVYDGSVQRQLELLRVRFAEGIGRT